MPLLSLDSRVRVRCLATSLVAVCLQILQRQASRPRHHHRILPSAQRQQQSTIRRSSFPHPALTRRQ